MSWKNSHAIRFLRTAQNLSLHWLSMRQHLRNNPAQNTKKEGDWYTALLQVFFFLLRSGNWSVKYPVPAVYHLFLYLLNHSLPGYIICLIKITHCQAISSVPALIKISHCQAISSVLALIKITHCQAISSVLPSLKTHHSFACSACSWQSSRRFHWR